MNVNFYPEVDLASNERPAVTLGNFDGVHLGHQRIMKLLVQRGEKLSVPTVAVTFEPHPISVLRPDMAPKRILTLEQKSELLGETGIDLLLIIEFTLELSHQEPEAFVREVLYEKLHASELVLGMNFRFGRGRTGDLDTLRSFGGTFDFEVRRVAPALDEDEIISSSRIRRVLADGAVTTAAAMLGRPYFVDGKVVKGDGRGKGLGFPTANLALVGDLVVADGVYATSARLGGGVHQGMSHVGRRPTFGIERRSVETHIFDFSEEVYDAPIRLFFHERLRETIAFDGPEALKQQLARDQEDARAFFRGPGRDLVL
jgi:riboflavin kinase/FMN adenylyltransferase